MFVYLLCFVFWLASSRLHCQSLQFLPFAWILRSLLSSASLSCPEVGAFSMSGIASKLCIGCGDEEMLLGLLINTAPILASLLTTSPTPNCHTLETQHLAKVFPLRIFSSPIPLWTRIQTTHARLRSPQRHFHSSCDSETSPWLRFFFHYCMLVWSCCWEDTFPGKFRESGSIRVSCLSKQKE